MAPLSKPITQLTGRFPIGLAAARAPQNPMADRLCAAINSTAEKIKRKQRILAEAQAEIARCTTELAGLLENAKTLGIQLSLDERTGLRTLSGDRIETIHLDATP